MDFTRLIMFFKQKSRRFQHVQLLAAFIGATSANAADDTLDLAGAHVVTTFGEFNLASNMVAVDGHLLMLDSLRDVITVRGINHDVAYDIPTTAQPQYVIALNQNQIAVSDPAHDRLSIVDWRRGIVRQSFHYTAHFGPSHLAFDGRTIFGSNRYDQLLTRYDTVSARAPAPLTARSGPTDLEIIGARLYLIEEGAADNPRDDHVVWYDKTTGTRLGQLHLLGSMRDITKVGDELCLILDRVNELRCGHPEQDSWVVTSTKIHPWNLVVVGTTIWVLTRGQDTEPATISSYVKTSNNLQLVAEYPLDGLAPLRNFRHLAFDVSTRSLLVRGDEGVLAIPLLNH